MYRVFISSVQREFAKERKAIAAAIRKDRVLRLFFEPFLFEETVACNRLPQKMYLDEVRSCDEIIARAMSWTSYVEKSGSGTGDIINKCCAWGLPDPEYCPDNVDFKTIIWRKEKVTLSLNRDRP